MKRLLSLLVLIFVLTLLVACSSDSDTDSDSNNDSNQGATDAQPQEPEEETEPVTLSFLFPWGEDLFNERIVPIDERLDDINIKLIDHGTGSTEGIRERIEELSAQNIIPDIMILGSNELLDDYVQEFVTPLDDLVEAHNFDLNKINPALIESVRSLDRENRLISFPNSNDLTVLYYNKAIFDVFGVDYPSGVMTWDEIIDLARQLTGERDGVTYRGLDIRDSATFPLEQRSINYTDPETAEVIINNEPAVQEYLQLISDIYNIPGNLPPEDSGGALGDFLAGNVAMTLYSPQFMRWGVGTPEKAETIDFVAAPVWASNPDATAPAKSHYHWIINKYSENKDAAFKVLMEYTSKEIQELISNAGQEMTILSDDEMKNQFGSELDVYQGKNIEGIFDVEPGSPPAQISKWDSFVNFEINEFIISDKDINQHIREVAEKAAINIENAKASN